MTASCQDLKKHILEHQILEGADGITGVDVNHRTRDELVHWIAENSFSEVTRSSGNVTNITIWTNSSKTTKIREEAYTYNSAGDPSTVTIIQYDSDGSIVTNESYIETFTYSDGLISSSVGVLS